MYVNIAGGFMEYLIIVNDEDLKRVVKEISKEKPLQKIKCMTFKKLLEHLYFSYTNETIYFLMKKYKVSKEIAKIYLNNLYLITKKKTNNIKLEFLNQLYDELLNENLITINELWKEKIRKVKIIFYHLERKDNFFQKVIRDCQKITRVEIINQKEIENQTIFLTSYQTIEEEVIGVCNKLCNFIKSGKEESELFLTNLTEEHRHFFDIYAPMFHLPLNIKKEESYYSNEIIRAFIKNYQNNLIEAISKIKEKYSTPNELEIIENIITISNRYAFIKDQDIKKELILEDLKEIKITNQKLKKAITEIDFYESEIPNNAVLFILSVNEGKFPKIYKDEDFLQDLEKEELELNTTSEQNELEKEKCFHKLKTFPHIHLSYAKKEGKTDLYPSSILELISFKEEQNTKEYTNSHTYNHLVFGQYLDHLRKYGETNQDLPKLQNTYDKIDYNEYKNEYTKVLVEKKEQRLSYSSLDTFFRCSFRFYLDHILHLNKKEETFDQKIGTLFHEILKKNYDENFDFEQTWNEQVSKIKCDKPKDQFFLKKLKIDLKRILDTLKKQEIHGFNVETEKKVSINFEEHNTSLVGIFDKIYWKKKQNETLISIIDYKTGTPSTSLNEVPYGIGIQLPIYLLLLQSMPYQNIKVIGFYLQKIISNIPERDNIHKEEDLKQKKLMLQGYSTNNEQDLKEFDPTYENSKLIAGMKISSKGFYTYSKVLSEEQLKKLKELTLNQIKKAITEINQNKFNINPKRIGQKLLGCDYCKYQCICYKKEKDIVNLKELKASEFLGGVENANLDERAK